VRLRRVRAGSDPVGAQSVQEPEAGSTRRLVIKLSWPRGTLTRVRSLIESLGGMIVAVDLLKFGQRKQTVALTVHFPDDDRAEAIVAAVREVPRSVVVDVSNPTPPLEWRRWPTEPDTS